MLARGMSPPEEPKCRRSDDFIEKTSCQHEQRESNDLQPFERLPTEAERYEPDEERATSVDGASCCG